MNLQWLLVTDGIDDSEVEDDEDEDEDEDEVEVEDEDEDVSDSIPPSDEYRSLT